MKKTRGFERVTGYENQQLPTRSDNKSAGYDFYSPVNITVPAHRMVKIPTGIKAYMRKDEVLMLYVRSSIGIKKNLMLANQTGVIDASFYNNPDNEGNITCALYNYGEEDQFIQQGDRIMQGVFMKYYPADNDIVLNKERVGGIGSSGV